jgi:hypothetical protein
MLSYVMISCIICPPLTAPHWSTVLADTTPSRERQPTPTKDQHPASIYKKFCFRRDSARLTSLLSCIPTLLTFCDLYLVSLLEINTNYIEPHILIHLLRPSSDNAVLAYLFIEIYLLWKVNVKFCYATLYHLLLFRLFSSWKYQEPCKDTNKPKCLLMTFRK